MIGIERPACERVRHSLSAIIASETFARSERLRSFLSYIVENELSGKAAHLKGYSIGIDVFARPPSFEAGNDPLVRVQAGKLRKLLEQYYETEGAADPIRIRVPVGSYVPEYHCLQGRKDDEPKPAESICQPAEPPRSARRAKPRRHWLPAPVSSHLALFSLLPLFFLAPSVCPDATNAAIGNAQFALSLKSQFPTPAQALPRLQILQCWPAGGHCNVFAHAIGDAAGFYGTVRAIEADETDPMALSYAIRVENQPDGKGIYVRLIHQQSGATIYTRHFTREQLHSEAGVAYEAVNFVARTLSATGPLYRHAMQAGIASSLMECLAGRARQSSSQTPEANNALSCLAAPPGELAESSAPR